MASATTFLIAFSAVFGTAEAIRHTQSDARKKEHRSRKNNLIVHCLKSSEYSPMLEGRSVVLSGDKLYIDTGTAYDVPFGHPFAGYFLPFPDTKYSGLVSTITADEPPMMNWIYVDCESHEVKFGTRAWAEPNYNGPFDCTRQDRRLTFGGWEGFYAVQEGPFWAIYFDVDQDQLQSKVSPGTPVIELELQRIEMRVKPVKPEEPEAKAEGGEAGKEGTENDNNNNNNKDKDKEQEWAKQDERQHEGEDHLQAGGAKADDVRRDAAGGSAADDGVAPPQVVELEAPDLD